MADSGVKLAEVGVASSGTVSSAEDGGVCSADEARLAVQMADSGAKPAEVGVASAVKARRAKVTKNPVPGVSGILFRKKPSVRPSPIPKKRKMTVCDETHDNKEVAPSGHVASANVMDDIQLSAEVTEDASANYNCTLSRNFSSMTSVLRQEISSVLHREIASRDVLLQKLEESVTRLCEDLIPLEEYMKAKMQEERGVKSSQTEASSEGTPLNGVLETEEQEKSIIRNRCIKAMMSMTEILEKTEEKTSLVKGFYETIYDTAPETSYILRILEKNREVKIIIDYGSENIGRLVSRIIDHDGRKRPGTDFKSFSDFTERKVYVAGKQGGSYPPAAHLAECLMPFAMRVIFGSKGCPYSFNDELMERVYSTIVEEAGSKFALSSWSYSCSNAHILKTTFAREIAVISAIPGILVKHGMKTMMSYLNGERASVFLFFNHHVLPQMMSYLRE